MKRLNAMCGAAWLGLCFGLGACTVEMDGVAVAGIGEALRPLSKEEALADFDTLVESFRAKLRAARAQGRAARNFTR
jgi:hypothetical protein